jgi:DNA-binding transcriptional ArsR family regulator
MRNIEMKSAMALSALSALAHEHRLTIFRLLVQAGPEGVSAGQIAENLGVPPSSLSFHLAHLNRAGLIAQRRESRSLIYSADFERIPSCSRRNLECARPITPSGCWRIRG